MFLFVHQKDLIWRISNFTLLYLVKKNLQRFLKLLGRRGLEPNQDPKQEKSKHQKEELMGQQKPIETTIAERLNENNKEVVLISSTVPIAVKGLFLLMGYSYLHNLCVYYFSTREHAQIINPSGKVVIGVLHHVDSYLNSEAQWFDLKDVMKYEVSYTLVYIYMGYLYVKIYTCIL